MPITGRPPKPLFERIAAKLQVNYETNCWEWTGYVDTRPGYLPYGRIKVVGNPVPVQIHRIMYEHFVGAIPAGLVIDHICRNGRCCNPSHLRVLTVSENSDGGWVKQFRESTHCAQGHPFSGDNLFIRKLKSGKTARGCRKCKRLQCAKQREKERHS